MLDEAALTERLLVGFLRLARRAKRFLQALKGRLGRIKGQRAIETVRAGDHDFAVDHLRVERGVECLVCHAVETPTADNGCPALAAKAAR